MTSETDPSAPGVTAPGRPPSLWRDRDFTAFWIGETASQIGTQITFVALPLVAVVTLHASAAQLGVLRFLEYLPFLLLSLPFGVWADRHRRRWLMQASYVLRGLMVLLVPVLAFLGVLNLTNLTVIAFLVGVGAALFDVCWMSYVPNLVHRDRLVEAMGKVATSHSASEVIGPGLGGLLVQVLTAPFALLADALSYLVGFISFARIRHREPDPRDGAPRRHVGSELAEGLRFTFTEPHIRATALTAALGNFFALITETVFLVHAIESLRLNPGLIGFVFSAIGAGGLVGAALAISIINRWPVGRVYIGARLLGGVGALLLPLAAGPTPAVIATCMASFFLVQAALANTNVLNASLRQVLTPDRLRGRMNASARTIVYGALPLGALSAGLLATGLGTQTALWIGGVGYGASVIPVLLSPIRRLRTLPEPVREGEHR